MGDDVRTLCRDALVPTACRRLQVTVKIQRPLGARAGTPQVMVARPRLLARTAAKPWCLWAMVTTSVQWASGLVLIFTVSVGEPLIPDVDMRSLTDDRSAAVAEAATRTTVTAHNSEMRTLPASQRSLTAPIDACTQRRRA